MEIIKYRKFNGMDCPVVEADSVDWDNVRYLDTIETDNPSDFEKAIGDISYDIIMDKDWKTYAVSDFNWDYISAEDLWEYNNSCAGIDYSLRN